MITFPNPCSRLVRVLLTVPISLGLLASLSSPVSAAPGDLDSSFDGDGKVITSIGDVTAKAYAVAIQPDGKTVVAGYATINDNGDDFAIVRYNVDGSLDSSFGDDGIVTTDIGAGNNQATAVAVQPDGKIVVAGFANMGATGDDFVVARYTAGGMLDSTFDDDGIATTDFGGREDRALSMALWSDGANIKIVVAGHADMDTSGFDFALAQYTSSGAPDSSFGGGKVTTHIGSAANAGEFAYALAVQPDGKPVAAGYAIKTGTGPDFALVRYNTDGSPDGTFGAAGIVTTHIGNSPSDGDYARAVVVQPGGKIVAAGSTYMMNTGYDVAVVRYTAAGVPDSSFSDDGIITAPVGSASTAAEDVAYGVAVQSNGKLVVAGVAEMGSTGSDFVVLRYGTDGTPDASFGSSGKLTTAISTGTNDSARAVVVQLDGKIVAAGSSADSFAVARYAGDPVPLAGLESPTGPYAVINGKVEVPVNLAFSYVELGAVGFSLDFGAECLEFDPHDGDDADDLPDAVSGIPDGFAASVDYDAADTDGELDISLTDLTDPVAGLPVGPLITIAFNAEPDCDPHDGSGVPVAMRFSASPEPSFGDTLAKVVLGSATASEVMVVYGTPPSGINLSNSSVAENQASGAAIGLLSVEDPASGETYEFAVVPDVWDFLSFAVDGTQLRTVGVFDLETKASYKVRIQVTGNQGTSLVTDFDIMVTDAPDAPTVLTLDKTTVPENSNIGTVIGTLATTDPDSGDTHTYTMVGGDDTAFGISVAGQQLITKRALDFETTPNSFAVRIRTTDKDDLTFEQEFVIGVTNVNEAPTAVDDPIAPSDRVFVGAGGQIDVLLNDTDPDAGTALRVSEVGAPDSGGASHNGSVVFFDPPDNANGTTSFAYTVSDYDPTTPLIGEANVTVTYVADDARGDCNADGAVNAADFVATVLEYFDAPPGVPWWEIYAEGFAGSPQGCNSNADTHADISDLICTVRRYFNSSCTAGVTAASLSQPALYLTSAESGDAIRVRARLNATGTPVAALAFELRFDPDQLQLAGPGDGADDVAATVTGDLPAGMMAWIETDRAHGRVQVVFAATTLPIVPLPVGELIEFSFVRTGDGISSLTLHNISAGDTGGARLDVVGAQDEWPYASRILLPMTER